MSDISFRIERSSRRRSVALHINDAEVIVRAPAGTSESWIAEWVASKREWILPRLQKQQFAKSDHQIDHLSDSIVISGIECQLLFDTDISDSSISLSDKRVDVKVSKRATERSKHRSLQTLLKTFAATELIKRTEQLSQFTGFRYRAVDVANYKSKWGQCSSRGEITLNWRLIHLAPQLQDYVIIHELCHLKEMNHSKRFWSLVAEFFPDYKVAKQEINERFSYLNW